MLIRETFTNETKGYNYGSSDPYEPYTNNRGELFRAMQREYGRCTSRIYIDRLGSPPIAIGWYFQKRVRYEDAHSNKPDNYFIRGVWVEIISPRIDEMG